MQAKRVLVLVLTVALACTLCACFGFGRGARSRNEPIRAGEASTEYTVDADGYADFGYGKYKVPAGFMIVPEYAESEGYTAAEKRYYVKDDEDVSRKGTGISSFSVEIGQNRYAMDEHERFRQGIVASLGAQLSADDVQASLSGAGTTTDEGYPLYTFTIEMEDVTVVQYYVVGDQKYLLISLAYGIDEPGEDYTAASLEVANSFIWK